MDEWLQTGRDPMDPNLKLLEEVSLLILVDTENLLVNIVSHTRPDNCFLSKCC